MKILTIIASALTLTSVLSSGIPADPAGMLPGGTSWTASPDLVVQLQGTRKVGHWHIRIPAGCKPGMGKSKGGLVLTSYWWPVRKDKSVCVMGITRYESAIPTPNGDEAKLRDLLDNIDATTIDGSPNYGHRFQNTTLPTAYRPSVSISCTSTLTRMRKITESFTSSSTITACCP